MKSKKLAKNIVETMYENDVFSRWLGIEILETEKGSCKLKMKVRDFEAQYLERDSDNFMVLKTAPCSFLDESDNSCFIYDVRPKACSEYPHTNRKKFIQIADLTIANTAICPATYRIVEELKKRLPVRSNEKIKRLG